MNIFFKLRKIDHIFSNKMLDLEKIFKVNLWIFANNEDNNKKTFFKNFISLSSLLLKTVYLSIFSNPLIIFPKSKKLSIFYIRAHSRPDLDKHSQCYENIEDTTVCIFSKRTKKVDIVTIFFCIFLLIKFKNIWLKTLNDNHVNLFGMTGFKIFTHFFGALSDVLKVFPHLMKHSKLVSFQEMVLVENLICQIANISNIKTFALQHSLSAYSEKDSYELRYPVTSYLNSVCKNILCWGNYNKFIFKKHVNSKIFVIGKPTLPDEKIFLEGVTIIFENLEFHNTNQKLLSISKSLIDIGISVSRWFKPNNPVIKDVIGRDGPLRKVIIGGNSSLLVELGYLGGRVFVTNESNIRNELPDDLILENSNEISRKFFSPNKYPHDVWKNFIDCSDKECVIRYKNIVLCND
jgi:hypothetical protein